MRSVVVSDVDRSLVTMKRILVLFVLVAPVVYAAYPTTPQSYPVTSLSGSMYIVLQYQSVGHPWGYWGQNTITATTDYWLAVGPTASSVNITQDGSGNLTVGTGYWESHANFVGAGNSNSINAFFGGSGQVSNATGNFCYVNFAVRNGSGGTNSWVILGAQKFQDFNTLPVMKKMTFTGTNSSGTTQIMGIHKQGTGLVYNMQSVPAGGTYTSTMDVLGTDTSSYAVATVDVNGKSATGEQVTGQSDGKGNFGADFGGTQWFTDQGTPQTQANGTTLTSPDVTSVTPSQMTPTGQQTAATAASGGPATNPFQQDTGGQAANSSPTGAPTQGSMAANTNAITNAIAKLGATVAAGATGGAGGGTDMTATNAKLDAIKAVLDKSDPSGTYVVGKQSDANSDSTTKAGAMSGQMSSEISTTTALAATLTGSGLLAGGTAVGAQTMGTSSSYASSAHVSGASDAGLIGAMGGVDSNPFTSAHVAALLGEGVLAQFAAWVRNFIGWCIVVEFLYFTACEVKETCRELGRAQQLRLSAGTEIVLHTAVVGNSIGVPAAGIMWGAGVIVVSTLILAAPTIIVAAFSSATGATDLISAGVAFNAAAHAVSGRVADALSYTDKFIPLVLVGTMLVNRVLVQVTAIAQWVVYNVGMKLVPF